MAVFPKLDRLKSQLNNSAIKQNDQALYQVINTLIDAVRQGFDATEESVDSIVIPPVPPNLANEDYLTWSNEVAQLPNSRNLIAGTGITFNDAVANQRTINGHPAASLVGVGDYLTLDSLTQVFTKGLVNLQTDVEGTFPSGSSIGAHNLLSSTHPDTLPDSPELGDIIVAGEPTPLDILRPIATLIVEDFYGIRPVYFGGTFSIPASGPYPQYYASNLAFKDFINIPSPIPFAHPITSLLEDDFIGIRPGYIHFTGTIPGSGPYPQYSGFPVEYVVPTSEPGLTSSGQWMKFPKGTEGQLFGIRDGSPRYLSDIFLPGNVNATRINGSELDITGTSVLHGLLDVGGNVFVNGLYTGNGIVSNLDISASDDIAAGGDITSANGYFEYGRSTKLGDPVLVTFAAGNFTGYDIALSIIANSWVLTSPDQVSFDYVLIGHTAIISVVLSSTTIANNPVFLAIEVPGLTFTSAIGVVNGSFIGGVFETCRNAINVSLNRILISRFNFATWPASTDGASFNVEIIAFIS